MVSKIYRESAGPIVRGEPIFEVSNLDSLELVADHLTTDAVRLAPKTKVRVLNWGGANHVSDPLIGEVSKISKAGAVKASALGVEEERTEVAVNVAQLPAEVKSKWGDNYHVDLEFVISEERGALIVPLGALYKLGQDWAVFVVENGKARQRIIQISKKNDRSAVVLKGLNEGEKVILFPSDQITDGSKVKDQK